MKFKIIGSGGSVSLPKPLCRCPVCVEARTKGKPYSRYGCSIYLSDIKLLIDTPEDIGVALNNSDVVSIENLAYTHWHPDHTMGMRVIEQLQQDWLQHSLGIEDAGNALSLYLSSFSKDEIMAISSKYGSFIEYYMNMNLVKLSVIKECTYIGDIKVSTIESGVKGITIFLFEQNDKKVIYAPCDAKPFPLVSEFYNADLLIIGSTFPSATLKNNFEVTAKNPMLKDYFLLDEVIALKKQLNISELIITHLEEDYGLSYADYLRTEKDYEHLKFAY
ncbi:MAG: MBL fold metallo-hydrolase [Muricomes sp.]